MLSILFIELTPWGKHYILERIERVTFFAYVSPKEKKYLIKFAEVIF